MVQEFIRRKGDQPDILHVHDWYAGHRVSSAVACCPLDDSHSASAKQAWRQPYDPPSASPPRRHTAPVSMLYWHYFSDEIRKASVVLTVHNFAQPGECRLEVRQGPLPHPQSFDGPDASTDQAPARSLVVHDLMWCYLDALEQEFSATGFLGDDFMTIERALDERTIGHNPERMCLLKGGLIYRRAYRPISPSPLVRRQATSTPPFFLWAAPPGNSHSPRSLFCSTSVTTVSPTYAKEVRGGGGGFLAKHIVSTENKFSGIVNGIDDDIWNPLTDPYLPANFSAARPQNKAVCKTFVQRGFGMRETEGSRVPLVVCISRLVPQKGVNLIEHAIKHAKAKGAQFILLGTGGSDAPLRAMALQMKDDPDVRFVFAFSDELSHHLYGAADMILVPSMFEPCGLTQMLGQRYGAVPIVRRTGGLADTVDPSPESGTGFSFDGQGQADVAKAVDDALAAFQEAPRWDALVKRCMTKDNRRE